MTSKQTEPIDIKNTAYAIQMYVLAIKRRIKDPEVLRLGAKALLKLEQLKQQIGEISYDKSNRQGTKKNR